MIMETNKVRSVCDVCPHACSLLDGQVGLCQARRAMDGVVADENYGRITSLALDPIEKKPLARFMPGSKVLSVGSYGCNLRCPFCQNASIACAGASDVPWREITPEQLADMAVDLAPRGNIGIALTYNEPLVGYEFVRDTAQEVHTRGQKNVLVSNGYANAGVIEELLPLIDAVNIDLKGFTEDFYRWVGGDLTTVKNTIAAFAATPTCHVEVTTLIIPGKNDSEDEIVEAAAWLASLDRNVVYHITRFFPCHKLQNCAPTPVKTVYHLAEVARQYLPYVYTGNC